ncbi:hypothetical protein ABWED_0765 [Acinetobacter lwoffii]|nr:hypothetical protein ABWED_0765 [Acinetobacter lwoffii]
MQWAIILHDAEGITKKCFAETLRIDGLGQPEYKSLHHL